MLLDPGPLGWLEYQGQWFEVKDNECLIYWQRRAKLTFKHQGLLFCLDLGIVGVYNGPQEGELARWNHKRAAGLRCQVPGSSLHWCRCIPPRCPPGGGVVDFRVESTGGEIWSSLPCFGKGNWDKEQGSLCLRHG